MCPPSVISWFMRRGFVFQHESSLVAHHAHEYRLLLSVHVHDVRPNVSCCSHALLRASSKNPPRALQNQMLEMFFFQAHDRKVPPSAWVLVGLCAGASSALNAFGGHSTCKSKSRWLHSSHPHWTGWRPLSKERVRRKKMEMREKVGKSRFTVFFQWFGAPEGRKVGSLKRRVRSQLARGEMKNCTLLWREAHFEVKMYKTPHVRATFGGSDVVSRGRRKGLCTLSKVTKTWGLCSIFNYNQHYITLHSTTLHYTTTTTAPSLHSTTLHSTTVHCTQLHSITLHYTTLHYITLHYTTLHYTTFHYLRLPSTTLHSTPLHCTTLHWMTLHHR